MSRWKSLLSQTAISYFLFPSFCIELSRVFGIETDIAVNQRVGI